MVRENINVTMPEPAKAARRFANGDEILGRYVVQAELGQGGMGVVYKCFDKVGGVEVAVKGLPPEVAHNSDEMEAVRENFQLVSELHHPNIAGVRTLEKDSATGDYYLVMTLARGVSLRHWLRQHGGKEHRTEQLNVLRQIASALDYAHDAEPKHIIHRDIKPENIMVDENGRVMVLDFGLAAQVRSSLSRVSQVVTSRSGTPAYKSPEQWLAQAQRAPSDQYSLGVIAYQMFAGELPFDSDDLEILKHAVVFDPVPPIPGEDKTVNTVFAKALAKKPQERFASCAAFVDVLVGSRVPRDRPSAGSPVRKNRLAAVLLGVLAVAALVGGSWWWQTRNRSNASTSSPSAVPAVVATPTPPSPRVTPPVVTQVVEKAVEKVAEKPVVTQVVEKVVERPVVTQVAETDVEKLTQGGSLANKTDVRQEQMTARPSMLSDGTKSILAKLERKVTLQLYISVSATNMPKALKAYAARVENILAEYERTANGRVVVETFDPKPGSGIEKTALRQGVVSQTADSGQPLYLGIVAVCGANREVLGELSPRTESVLEYDVTRLVSRVARTEKPVIGLMTSLKDVLGVQRAKQNGQSSSKGWAAFAELAKNYEVKSVATDVAEIDPAVRTLVVLHAKDLSDKTLFAIDQFVLRGGKLIACVDPFSVKDMIACRQQQENPMMLPGDGPSTLGKLFDAWGVKFETTKITCDLAASTKLNNGQGGFDDNPAFLSLGKGNMDKSDILVQNLSLVMFPFAGAFDFDVKRGMGLKFEPVITTSREKSGSTDTVSMILGGGVKGMVPDGSARILVARLSGTFKTAYPSGPDGTDKVVRTLAEGQGSVMLFADSDFFADDFCVRMMKTPFGNIPKLINDNLTLFSNVIEQYAGDEELIGICLRKDLEADKEPCEEQKNAEAPCESARGETAGPCDVVVLIDASGSVGSDRFKPLCRKVVEGLSRFGAGCRFNLLLFRNTSKTAFDSWREVNGDSLRDASAWLVNQAVYGRTDLMSALEGMLKLEIDRNRRTYAVLLTDADDNLTDALQARVDRFNRVNAGRVRLYAYGIKSSCNRELLKALTSENHGELIVDEGTRWNCGGLLSELFAKVIADSNESAGPRASVGTQTEDKEPKPGEEREFELVKGVKMKFCWCPPGKFSMGSDDGDNDEKPVHEVNLTQGFWMGKYEVTQRQWSQIINVLGPIKDKDGKGISANPSWFSSSGGGRDSVSGLDTSDFPVENVSWDDCDRVIRALNASRKDGLRLSLPTEAQWEYAAKGGEKSRGYRYAGGNDMSAVGWYYENSGNSRLDDATWKVDKLFSNKCRTHSVDEKDARNELGLVGMSGNVWEWCSDWYDKGYYGQSPSRDPQGSASGASRVNRGGGWSHDAQCCRSTLRYGRVPGLRECYLGFRLVCSAGPRKATLYNPKSP